MRKSQGTSVLKIYICFLDAPYVTAEFTAFKMLWPRYKYITMYSFQQQAFFFFFGHKTLCVNHQVPDLILSYRHSLLTTKSSTKNSRRSCRTIFNTFGKANERCAACCCFWNCLAFQSIVTVGLKHM